MIPNILFLIKKKVSRELLGQWLKVKYLNQIDKKTLRFHKLSKQWRTKNNGEMTIIDKKTKSNEF